MKLLRKAMRSVRIKERVRSAKSCRAVPYSALSKETKKEVANRAAGRFWKDYGSVIERLSHE